MEPDEEDDPEECPQVDLHGLRPDQALRRVAQELHAARVRGHRHLLVICGRGWGNLAQQPVLRGKVEAWLRSEEGIRCGAASFEVTAKGGALLVTLGCS